MITLLLAAGDSSPMWSALIPVAVFTGEFAFKLAVISYILIRPRARPEVSLTWIIVILAVPFVGIAAYLMVGEVRLGSRRIKRYQHIHDRVEKVRAGLAAAGSLVERADTGDFHQIATLGEAVGGYFAKAGNTIKLLPDTDAFMDALICDVENASDHCHLLFYIYHPDGTGMRLADALITAVARGVACRLLVDSVGSRTFLKSSLCAKMSSHGVDVLEALPARFVRMLFKRIDLRNHRKIAVIDNTIGYTGSQNILDADFAPKQRFAPWVDMMVRLRGPAVGELHALFAQDWLMDTDSPIEQPLAYKPPEPSHAHEPKPIDEDAADAVVQVMGTGPASHNEAMRNLMLTAVHAAREEIILTTPYFVPDQAMRIAIETASQRGVRTVLIVPHRNDSPLIAAASRSYYEPLLRNGIEILEYTGGLLHAKTTTIDRSLAIVSTANLDRRSFEINFEVSLVVYDSDFASKLRLLQKSYTNQTKAVSAAQWARRGWPTRLWHNAAGIFSPLL